MIPRGGYVPDSDATPTERDTTPEPPAGAGGGSPHWEREAERHKTNFVGALERAHRAEALSEQHWRLLLSYQEYFKKVEGERDAAIAYREDAERYANDLLKLLNRVEARMADIALIHAEWGAAAPSTIDQRDLWDQIKDALLGQSQHLSSEATTNAGQS